MSYETKHSTYNNNLNYEAVKEDLIDAIYDGVETIFLVGSGKNGKSYLTNEMYNFLNINNYTSYHDKFYNCRNASSFNETLNTTPGKKLVHLLFNPFEKWDILMPLNSQIISMEHIKF